MRKKGFTLIELLAVIVLLAIIALIATPAVLNIIEDSRKSATEASVRNIVETAKSYYMQNIANNNVIVSVDLSKDDLKYSGKQAIKGSIEYDTKGNIYGKMYINGYCVIYKDGKIESEKMNVNNCVIKKQLSFPIENGMVVYFNPTTGLRCNSYEAISKTGTKSGCMAWYTFLTNEDDSNVNLLLAHNTTAKVAWNSDSTGIIPNEVITILENDTIGWKQNINGVETNLNARLISAKEVNQIAPTNPKWQINSYQTWYYLHTGTNEQYLGEIGTNEYAWLFDNTVNCTKYGCNESSNGTYGYWTSDYASYGYAWYVNHSGYFVNLTVNNDTIAGVRPVIEVSKEVFK